MSAVRVALIGCGNHSEHSHAIPLARYARQHADELVLAAACDRQITRAREFTSRYGFAAAYNNLDEMLAAQRVDACVCVMPLDQIAPVSGEILRRGIPCVIEKPLGATLEEARELARVAKSSGTAHVVSVNRRFMPHLNRALDAARAFGPIRFVRAAMLRPARTERGFIVGTGVHAIDTMRHLAGDVSGFVVAPQRGNLSATWWSISMKFADGAIGRADILPTAGVEEESYEFCGEGYRAVVAWQSPATLTGRIWRDGKLIFDERPSPDEPTDVTRGEFEEVRVLVNALRTGAPLLPTIDDVLPSVELCHEIARRAEVAE